MTRQSEELALSPRSAVWKISGLGFGWVKPDVSTTKSKLSLSPSRASATCRLRGVAEVARAIRNFVFAQVTNSFAPWMGWARCSTVSNSKCFRRSISCTSTLRLGSVGTTSLIMVSSGRPLYRS